MLTNGRLVSVFGASTTQPGTPEWEEAETLGRLLAEAGFAVATGGYGGSMEAVSKGAKEGNPDTLVLGVTAPDVFKSRSGANPFVTEEVRAPHLLERIHHLTERSVATVALPGALGTLTELLVAWNLAHVAPFAGLTPKPVVALGPRWARVLEALAKELDLDTQPIYLANTAEDAVTFLHQHAPQNPSPTP